VGRRGEGKVAKRLVGDTRPTSGAGCEAARGDGHSPHRGSEEWGGSWGHLTAGLLGAEGGSHGENGQQQAEGEEADGRRHDAENERLDEADGLVHGAVRPALDGVGDLHEHLVQFVGFLGDGDHREDLVGEEVAFGQRFGEALAVAHGLGALGDALGELSRISRLYDGVQRLSPMPAPER